MSAPLRILVTACRAPAGASVMLLLRDDERVTVEGVDCNMPGVPRGDDHDYMATMRPVFAAYDHVIVTSDLELEAVARGPRPDNIVCCHPHALTIALDKALLYEQFAAMCPRPAFLKSRRKLSPSPEPFLAVERLNPPEFSIDALFWEGELVAAVCRRRDVVRERVARECFVERYPHLVGLLVAINDTMPLHGIVNAQFMRRGSAEPVLTDLNLRPPGGLTISAAAGVNFPRLLVDLILDGRPLRETVPTSGLYRSALP